MNRRRYLTLSSAAAAGALAPLSSGARNSAPENFKLFLLIGQSNMAGRGQIDPANNEPHERVWSFDKEQQWVPAVDPLHFDKPKIVGVGLGRTFANVLAENHPDWNIGLIPCAVGGSPIGTWKPGAKYDALGVHPYDDAIERAKAAIESGTLAGILWHQGESDSGKPELQAAYEANLKTLIAQLRSDLNAPDVPFLIGELGHFPDRGWTDREAPVNVAHREIAKSVPNCAWVSSEGLEAGPDGTHFDAESFREFGRRYAKVWEENFGG